MDVALVGLIARKAAAVGVDRAAPAVRGMRKGAGGALPVGPARAAQKPKANKVAAVVALAVSNKVDAIHRVPTIHVRVIRI